MFFRCCASSEVTSMLVFRRMIRESEDSRIGRRLIKLLRHEAEQKKVPIGKDGFVCVADIMKLREFQNLQLKQLFRIMENDSKQRFGHKWLVASGADGSASYDSLCAESRSNIEAFSTKHDGNTSNLYIRANQGHSLSAVSSSDLLQPIYSMQDIIRNFNPYERNNITSVDIIHGTFSHRWPMIQRIGGLSRCSRRHIHFAIYPHFTGSPCTLESVSTQTGIPQPRPSSQIHIKINFEKAVAGGIKFYISQNKVILTEGDDNGFLSCEYFSKVTDIRSGKELKI